MHAGVEESRLNLIVFDDEPTLRKLLEGLGLTLSPAGSVRKEGKTQHCSCCDQPLTVTNLGNVMPGSLELFCAKPTCLAEYVLRYRGF